MTIRRLILREIGYRKLNFSLAVLSVAVTVACLAALVILLRLHDLRTEEIVAAKEVQTRAAMKQLEDDYRKITLRLGFNLHILPEKQDLGERYAEDGAPVFMPEQHADRLAKSGVATINHVLPILQERVTWEEKKRSILLKGTRGELAILDRQEKKPLRDAVPPGTVVVGHELHRSLDLARGDKITLTLSRRIRKDDKEFIEALPGAEFMIHKLQSATGTPEDITLWVNLKEAQALLNRPGQISEILALECNCEADRLARIRAEISTILPGTQVIELGPQALARAETRNRAAQEARDALQREKEHRQTLKDQQEEFALILIPLLLLGSMIGVGLLAFQNVRDRAAEIGILRALGMGKAHVLAIFFGKASLVGLVGACLGYSAGSIIAGVWGEYRLSLGLLLEPSLISMTLLGTPLLCVAVSWFPAREASRQDPAVVLRED
jgi:putative ABC transport system permease protein